MTIQFGAFTTFVAVFVRMAGMIALNPIFARNNIPRTVITGLILLITILMLGTVPPVQVAGTVDMVIFLLGEGFIGFLCGYIFRLFYYMLQFVGDIMDTQFGMAMSKVFDPGASIQVSLTGRLMDIMFMVYFFATGSHLILFRIFATSYLAVPIGSTIDVLAGASFVVSTFFSVFAICIKLLVPFIVAELLLEVSMGILMKLIPQIHIFVINIQLKILLGIVLLYVFLTPVSNFIDRYITILLETTQKVLYSI